MSKKDIHTPTGTLGVQLSGHPNVKNSAPGPMSKQVHVKAASSPPAPNKGQTAGSSQSGSTSPKTDSGGGMGNSSEALHRQIFGK